MCLRPPSSSGSKVGPATVMTGGSPGGESIARSMTSSSMGVDSRRRMKLLLSGTRIERELWNQQSA
jgi:hypothetical protein